MPIQAIAFMESGNDITNAPVQLIMISYLTGSIKILQSLYGRSPMKAGEAELMECGLRICISVAAGRSSIRHRTTW